MTGSALYPSRLARTIFPPRFPGTGSAKGRLSRAVLLFLLTGSLLLSWNCTGSRYADRNAPKPRSKNSAPASTRAKKDESLSVKSFFANVGEASYYDDKFEGRITTNGEVFSQDSLTAAHLSLPFGTKVRVTNLKNNKSVVVRINDRPPDDFKRLIDLSRRAAKKLDMLTDGIAEVRISVLP
jgi:rare lipoprotein A